MRQSNITTEPDEQEYAFPRLRPCVFLDRVSCQPVQSSNHISGANTQVSPGAVVLFSHMFALDRIYNRLYYPLSLVKTSIPILCRQLRARRFEMGLPLTGRIFGRGLAFFASQNNINRGNDEHGQQGR
jgi:hypothetical protein